MESVEVLLTKKQIAKVEALAKERDKSFSEVVNEAIEDLHRRFVLQTDSTRARDEK